MKEYFRRLKEKFVSLEDPIITSNDLEETPLFKQLKQLFAVYNTSNLTGISASQFTDYIQSKIGDTDWESEGFTIDEVGQQRKATVKFYWGHDHDFGSFKLEGMMGARHVDVLENFINLFPISIDSFKGKKVFDIGCWTGGTTLLLASLAENVLAIEEVKKYANMATFLTKSFGVSDRVNIIPTSIYDCNSEDYFEKFDIVYCPGVIYHLSDPLLALRILFNSLKISGVILIESAYIDSDEPIVRFDGSKQFSPRNRETDQFPPSGWNWFRFSRMAIFRMMDEVGFEKIETNAIYTKLDKPPYRRLYAYGKKVSRKSMCKAGLSIQNIK